MQIILLCLLHRLQNPVFTVLTIKHILSSQSNFDELLLSDQFPNLTQLRVVLDACNFGQLAWVLTKLL
jgi:hypothetical protein